MAAPSKFDVARQRLGQQVTAGKQEQEDALKRRFAALGGAGSGAQIKQEQLVKERAQQQLAQGTEAIGAQEQEEQRQQAEIEKQRQFQSAERQASEAFQAAQQEKGMGFAREQFEFQKGRAAADDVWRQKAFDLDSTWKEKTFGAQGDQFRQQMEMASRQFDLDQQISDANLRIQNKMANKKGIFEQFGSTVGDVFSPSKWKF